MPQEEIDDKVKKNEGFITIMTGNENEKGVIYKIFREYVESASKDLYSNNKMISSSQEIEETSKSNEVKESFRRSEKTAEIEKAYWNIELRECFLRTQIFSEYIFSLRKKADPDYEDKTAEYEDLLQLMYNHITARLKADYDIMKKIQELLIAYPTEGKNVYPFKRFEITSQKDTETKNNYKFSEIEELDLESVSKKLKTLELKMFIINDTYQNRNENKKTSRLVNLMNTFIEKEGFIYSTDKLIATLFGEELNNTNNITYAKKTIEEQKSNSKSTTDQIQKEKNDENKLKTLLNQLLKRKNSQKETAEEIIVTEQESNNLTINEAKSLKLGNIRSIPHLTSSLQYAFNKINIAINNYLKAENELLSQSREDEFKFNAQLENARKFKMEYLIWDKIYRQLDIRIETANSYINYLENFYNNENPEIGDLLNLVYNDVMVQLKMDYLIVSEQFEILKHRESVSVPQNKNFYITKDKISITDDNVKIIASNHNASLESEQSTNDIKNVINLKLQFLKKVLKNPKVVDLFKSKLTSFINEELKSKESSNFLYTNGIDILNRCGFGIIPEELWVTFTSVDQALEEFYNRLAMLEVQNQQPQPEEEMKL